MTSFNDAYLLLRHIDHQCSKTGNEMSCENPSYFHCNISLKCISYHRVTDGFDDCYYREDELFSACQLKDSNRFTCPSDENKCLARVAVGNTYNDCPKNEDESMMSRFNLTEQVAFQAMCNNFETFISIINEDETDETDCEWWPCDHPYLRCNGVWNCPNGIDELNCPYTSCSFNEFQCNNNHLDITYCLPLSHMFYKQIYNCSKFEIITELYFNNETNNIRKGYYSFNTSKCINGDMICGHHLETVNVQQAVCRQNDHGPTYVSNTCEVFKLDNSNTYMCTMDLGMSKFYVQPVEFLITTGLGYFPSTTSTIPSIQHISNGNENKKNIPQIDAALAWYCHQGILLLSGINHTKTCLCPPNYFGSQCQWQNQRVSLTLQLKTSSIISTTTIFQLIIVFIDEQGIIATNHEQITYIPAYQCKTKYNIYLLYPHRPKRSFVNYSIHIDLFDKATLNYWTSWYVPIPFQFLPVNRISTQLFIPEIPSKYELCSLPCGEHGRCMKYTNMKSLFFCQCDQGYSGYFCNNTYQCQCSNSSLCLAPSICVCPLNKFGSRCYLKRSICQSTNNPCQNNGLCIPIDDRLGSQAFICICEKGYSGERCQYKDNQINIHIDETIISINSSFFIHYITAFNGLVKHERTTILKKIPFAHNTITVHVSQPFNILFVQIPDGNYYLAVLRETFIPTELIQTQILPKQRCSFINDLLNSTIREYVYLRRVKYYPLLCEQDPQLMCFYDEYNMCICDSHRFSNCFKFNSTVNYHCKGENLCKIGSQCFQNNETCPTKFICLCEDCYYGERCHLSTKGFLFSLDPILGYHIKPNVTISQQPFIVKLSIGITTIMLILGLILGSFSVAVFQLKQSREVGCGYYLLASSISSICLIIILTIKFWHLVLSQMLVITNRSMLFAGCISIEIILKVLLVSSEWLNTCVAIERMINVIKGVKFNKNKSKIIAKRMIFLIIILTIVTHIHDPCYRQLIDDLDGDQRRIWCFSKYPSSVMIYNSFITIFNLLAPFSINSISALILIIVAARSRFKIDSKQSLRQHLQLQFQQHKHIIIAPIALVLLSLPRLIISFISGCMRSPREPWLHLIGYFLSFIPTILTFFVFVLPSTTYKGEFDKMIKRRFRRLC